MGKMKDLDLTVNHEIRRFMKEPEDNCGEASSSDPFDNLLSYILAYD